MINVQRGVAQITDAAMPEIEHHSNAIRAVQSSDDGIEDSQEYDKGLRI